MSELIKELNGESPHEEVVLVGYIVRMVIVAVMVIVVATACILLAGCAPRINVLERYNEPYAKGALYLMDDGVWLDNYDRISGVRTTERIFTREEYDQFHKSKSK